MSSFQLVSMVCGVLMCVGLYGCSDPTPNTTPEQPDVSVDLVTDLSLPDQSDISDMDAGRDLDSDLTTQDMDMDLSLSDQAGDLPDMSSILDMSDMSDMADMSDMSEAPTRAFLLAFSVWPYDATLDAIKDTYVKIKQESDVVTHHLQGGIPWQDAADGVMAYRANIEGDVCGRLQQTYDQDGIVPDAMGRCFAPTRTDRRPVVLAIDSLNQSRHDMAGYWDVSESEPLANHTPWDTAQFDDQAVADAYATFALDMIDRFKPGLVNIGTEASDLLLHDQQRFAQYVVFIGRVATQIKAKHPMLPILVSVALKAPGSSAAQLMTQKMPSLIQHIDVVGVSVYPFAFFDPQVSDPAQLPTRWLSQVNDYAGGRPIAITETGWIAETLTIPEYNLTVAGTVQFQRDFVQALFDECQRLECLLINWFTVADYDKLWTFIGQDSVSRIWRDTGLFDDALQARPALSLWRQWRQRDVVLRQ